MKYEEITRTFDIPYYCLEKYNKEIALAHRSNGSWLTVSSGQYVEKIREISRALLSKGVKKGDKIAIVSGNRMEWVLCDMAIMQIGAITVPVYPTITVEEYKYIFNHSGVKMCFCSDKKLFGKIEEIRSAVPALKDVYTFEEIDGAKHYSDLVKLGSDKKTDKELEGIMAGIDTEDIATIIYTSGTTGTPKGVMLSHRNITSNVKTCRPRLIKVENTRSISFLPLCHIFERTVNMFEQSIGLGVYFSTVETIAADAMDAKPVIMTAVPRVVEKLYNKIIAKGQSMNGIKKMIFFWAINVAKRYRPYSKNAFYNAELTLARKLVLSKFKDALGGELRYLVSGSSALDKQLIRIFTGAGIILMEGYGLTETSPIVGVNYMENRSFRIGSIGRPYENIDVKIAGDGEILVKGESVMKGYYKDPERTAEAFTEDGYFMTGDIGKIKDSFLFITDRKKEIFKSSGGKYIAPQPIEIALTQSRFIEYAMVVGENRKHPSVIIQPEFAFLRDWCKIKGVEVGDDADMVKNQKVVERIRKIVNELNKHLPGYEKIKKVQLVPDRWSMDGGELTPTLKLKRRVMYEKYAGLINGMYADEGEKELVKVE